MDIKKQKFIAYCAVAAFFVVGVVCYAAFPEKKPEIPVRVMFHSTAGNVLFFHKEHATEKVYGLKCTDCHHKWVKAANGEILYLRKDGSTGKDPVACSTCHKVEKAEGDNPKQPTLSDAIHERCGGCHDKTGHGPGTKDCSGCHVL